MSQAYSFQELLFEQLNDLYNAELEIGQIIPKIIDVTSSGELRKEFEHYLSEVNNHIEYLNKIFEDLNFSSSGGICKAVNGMLKEVDTIIHHGGNSAVKDASLIAVMQKIQHYKMAGYGTARTFARYLQSTKVIDLHNLQRALNEEAETDKKLTKLAEGGIFTSGINEQAAHETITP